MSWETTTTSLYRAGGAIKLSGDNPGEPLCAAEVPQVMMPLSVQTTSCWNIGGPTRVVAASVALEGWNLSECCEKCQNVGKTDRWIVTKVGRHRRLQPLQERRLTSFSCAAAQRQRHRQLKTTCAQ